MFGRSKPHDTSSPMVRRYSRPLAGRPQSRVLSEPMPCPGCAQLPRRRLSPGGVIQLMVGLVVLSVVLSAVYYFNVFVDLEQNVATAEAQIDRELQRRADLIRNLLPAVFEYAELEKHVFTEVAKVRTQLAGIMQEQLPPGAETAWLDRVPPLTGEQIPTGLELPAEQLPLAPQGGAGLPEQPPGIGDPFSELVGRLFAVSEQYPDMKSSAPFQKLMDKITEIEDRLAVERQKYNDCVNIYTTLTSSFPGKVFARAFGFDDRQLFTAEPDARTPPYVGWPVARK